MATFWQMVRHDPVYSPVIAGFKGVFALQGLRFKVSGSENVPEHGPAVMMINHTGYMDFTYAGLAAWPRRRLVRFMAKESVFRHWASGPLMKGMRHIPVDRAAGSASYQAALDALRAGEIVGVFPEATISQSFEPKEFKTGGVRMAQATGAPVLPVAIWGSQRVWTKGHPKRLGRSGVPIGISVASPIHVGPEDDVVEVTARVKATITAMLHELQEVYPPVPEAERHLVPARLGGTAPTPEEVAARATTPGR